MNDCAFSTKQPFRRLEAFVRRCTDIAIPLHVELLRKHRGNINKFRQLNEWSQLQKEQINASRVVEQLKADMVALDRLGKQIVEEDMAVFIKRTKPVEELVSNVIKEFAEENVDSLQQRPYTSYSNEEQLTSTEATVADDSFEMQRFSSVEGDLRQRQEINASWNTLLENIQDLNESFHTLSTLVHEQQEDVTRIDENLIVTNDNVNAGRQSLEKALRYKATVYPVAGAAIGSCLAGPFGLMVGLKVGFLAAAVGGILGYQGGRLLKSEAVAHVDEHSNQFGKDKHA